MNQICPGCQTTGCDVFFSTPALPVHCNRLWQTESGARSAPRVHIDLALCHRCGLIFNASFDATLIEYDGGYENALHFSGVFQSFEDELIGRLSERYDLHGKCVADIGCGDAHFLSKLAAYGGNRGVGFDPSYRGPPELSDGVCVVAEAFPSSNARFEPDFVTCRHVLEHIYEPLAFLRELKAALSHRQAAVYFEVPSADYMLRRNSFWDVMFEHCLYLGQAAMVSLFERAGFEVGSVYESFKDQFLSLEAETSSDQDRPGAAGQSNEAVAGEFASAYESTIATWDERLAKSLWEGRRIALWGPGTKGVTFLNSVPAAANIAQVVDMNPRKQGRFVAGGGQRILAPAELKSNPPDIVLLMNPAYEAEVKQELTLFGISPEVCIV